MSIDWKIKMRLVIQRVLGDNYDIEYISPAEFRILFCGKEILHTISAKLLPSHWREHAKNTIIFIIEKEINKNLILV